MTEMRAEGPAAAATPGTGRRTAADAGNNDASEGALQSDLTDEDKARYAHLAIALTRGPQFESVATAHVYSRTPPAVDEEQANAMRRFYPRLVEAFVVKYGATSARFWWCTRIQAAASLTTTKSFGRRRVQLWYLNNSYGEWPAGEQLLLECVALNEEIEYHLGGVSQARCRELLYDVVTTTLLLLDRRRGSGPQPAAASARPADGGYSGLESEDSIDSDAANVTGRLAIVREQFDLAAKRTLQFRYLFGMAFVGVASVVGALIVLRGQPAQHLLWAAASAGAAGAVVSTLVRMSDRRGLRLASELAPIEALWLGASRTLLGVIFGIVLYLLLTGGLVSLTPPHSAHRAEFYAALAFAAGFSERLIPDTLGVVGALVTARGGDADGNARGSEHGGD